MKAITILTALVLAGCGGTEPRIVAPPPVEGPTGVESLTVQLPAPSSEADAAYLGVSGSSDSFRMDQIRARVLVVEVFDMYCRFCQGMAPKVDEVFLLNQRSGFGEDVKMIGVGRTNTELEVSTFRNEYKVRFPLFADKDLSITRSLQAQDEGTPHFIVIRMGPEGRAQVVYRSTGAFEDPEAFYEVVLERSGMLRKE